eukprot:Pompholyxophrys_punicea_v1_NODE_719_length_1401_cov_9.679792.p1 type:complete len:135 gc:universal NODE_719_length_1401_cov_9.679792:74-478(+)
MSPKCHLELAGVGIEYNWEKSKLEFRRNINDEEPSHLHANILKSLSTSAFRPLPLARVRKFARKRDNRNVYREWDKIMMSEDGGSLEIIEKMRKTRKTHRNIVDLEMRYLLHSSPKKSAARTSANIRIEPRSLF